MNQKLQIIFLLLFIIAVQIFSIGWVSGKKCLLLIGAIVGIVGFVGAVFIDPNKKE